MSDSNGQMPMFDDPLPQEIPAKKPRKPARAKRGRPRKTPEAVVAKPAKKPRAIRKAPVGAFSRDQYKAIRLLLGLSDRELTAVLEVVRGLSK